MPGASWDALSSRTSGAACRWRCLRTACSATGTCSRRTPRSWSAASYGDRGADPELSVEEIRSLDDMLGEVVVKAELVMTRPLETRSALELRDLLTETPGSVPVVFRVQLPGCNVRITSGERYCIEPDEDLTRSIEQILGPGCVRWHRGEPSLTVH